jgi:hypothetical protein
MLADFEIHNILKRFPKIELSYETIVHKKVHNADVIFAIPEGKKCFAWFTVHNQRNVCFLLELGNNRDIINVTICHVTFDDILSFGTILYGTLFHYNNNSFFSVEDILFFRGSLLDKSKSSFVNKLTILQTIFDKYITQTPFGPLKPTTGISIKENVLFGLPIYCKKNEFNKLLNDIETLPYKIKTLRFVCLKQLHKNQNQVFVMNYYRRRSQYQTEGTQQTRNAVFKITPDIQNDIYYLHTYNFDTHEYEYYDIAFIPDYKTSVMMNKLFRNIKENTNLDLLEESDDEEEFENNNLDKFVFLNKSMNMKCGYNTRFKKWAPISIAYNHERVVTKNQLS